MENSSYFTGSTGPSTWNDVVNEAPQIFRSAFAKAWMRQKIPGVLWDDVLQEAWIGLWYAWRTYDAQQGRWEPWAIFLIRRRIADYVRRARRVKHYFLNSACSLDRMRDLNGLDERTGYDVLVAGIASARMTSVEDAVFAMQIDQWIARQIVLLTPLERAAWCGRQAGESLGAIAQRLGRPWKSVDNAWQRVTRKLRRAWARDWGETP